jgi:hypothetical protein
MMKVEPGRLYKVISGQTPDRFVGIGQPSDAFDGVVFFCLRVFIPPDARPRSRSAGPAHWFHIFGNASKIRYTTTAGNKCVVALYDSDIKLNFDEV